MSPARVAVSKIWPPTGTLGDACVVMVGGTWARTAGENSEVLSRKTSVAVAVTNVGPVMGMFGAEKVIGAESTGTTWEPR